MFLPPPFWIHPEQNSNMSHRLNDTTLHPTILTESFENGESVSRFVDGIEGKCSEHMHYRRCFWYACFSMVFLFFTLPLSGGLLRLVLAKVPWHSGPFFHVTPEWWFTGTDLTHVFNFTPQISSNDASFIVTSDCCPVV